MFLEFVELQIACVIGSAEAAVVPIYVPARRLMRYLTGITASLVGAHFLVMYSKYELGHDHLLGLVRMFDLLRDANLPTWYSSATLLSCSALLLGIGFAAAHTDSVSRWHWFGLAAVTAYISLDETAMIHESVQATLRFGVDLAHPLYALASVVFTGALAIVVVTAYLRFVLALPSKTRALLIVAAALFVGGALVMDFAGELHKQGHGEDNMTFATFTGLEELLEMAGVLVLLHSLLDFIHRHVDAFEIRVG